VTFVILAFFFSAALLIKLNGSPDLAKLIGAPGYLYVAYLMLSNLWVMFSQSAKGGPKDEEPADAWFTFLRETAEYAAVFFAFMYTIYM
jgi:hypothetical protein